MRLGQRLADMHAAREAESRDPATLRRTVGMDCESTDPDQTGGGLFAGLVDELARAIDAYERRDEERRGIARRAAVISSLAWGCRRRG